MTALTSALPRKSSRTSTKEMARPAMELTTATMADSCQRELQRGHRLGLGDGASRRRPAPLKALAKSGGQGQQDQQRQVGDGEAGRPGRPPGRAGDGRRRRRRRRSGRPAPRETQVVDGDARLLTAAQELAVETPSDCSILATIPVVRVEELRVDRGPAAELVDGEQGLGLGEIELGRHRGQHRAVALLAPHGLAGGGEQVGQEGLGGRAGRLGHRDRVLDQDRLRRGDDC